MEKILLVDDDLNVLEGYKRQYRKHFHIHTAENGAQGLETVTAQGPFPVIVSDCRMPGMDGIQFLKRIRNVAPDTVRIMLTGNNDLDTAMEAVNQGEIFRFLTKPCSPETFRMAIEAGFHQYRLIRVEKELLEQTLKGSLEALSDVLSFVHPEAFGRAARVKRYVTGLADHMGLSDIWRFEISAALSQIGFVILPDSIVRKVHKGEALTPNEMQGFHQHPCSGADLLAKIPRMKEVSENILYQEKHFDGSGVPRDSRQGEEIPLGARLLKVAIDFDILRMQDVPRSEAFEKLEERKEWYDPTVLTALKAVFVPEQKSRGVELSVTDLKPHMVLADGIFDKKGNLLIAKGQDLKEWMVTRLKQMDEERTVREPIRVILAVPSSEENPTLPPLQEVR